jgi:lipoprotein-anchoring transpeptidase ErfK/SrfK
VQGMRTHRLFAAIAAVGLVGGACSGGGPSKRVSIQRRATTSTSTTAELSTSSTRSPTTRATAPPLPGLGVGARGQAVADLETKLASLKYDPGKVDGYYDSTTAFAVTAFQKVNGMARTGRATDDVVAAVMAASEPPAMLPAGGATRVEVDLKRQVLFLFQNGGLLRILPVSTGSGRRYCVDGECAIADTPGGSFRIGYKILGPHKSKLGVLYNPLFFNGGIAIHGEPAVPSYPASHGCVRIPMADSLWFYNTVGRGTPVYVLGGKIEPVPFNEAAPDGTPPAVTAPPTTSTTTPPTTAPPHPTSTVFPSQSTTTSTTTPPTTAPKH